MTNSASASMTTMTPQEPTEPKPLVLLADDEPWIRKALRRFLSTNGYEILEAENGARALELARERQPDIAVLDLFMPEPDGFAVAASLKAERPEAVHVIVLSAADDSEHRLRAFDAGADDFVSKPANPPELIRRIQAARRMQAACRAEKQAREQAERLHVMHTEAVSLLAHDLNNGFTVIMSSLQFMEETLNVEGEEKESLDASMRALRRMVGLTSNFVDVSRIEEGVLAAQRSDLDIAQLVTETAEIHRPVTDPDWMRLSIQCEPGLVAEIDPALTERVLHNLIGNAVRYVDRGGTVEVCATGLGDRIRITVSNSGSPVPETLRPHLFDKYRKGLDGRAMRGMGLYFCRLACEAHGGWITLDPDFEGARFVVELPGNVRQKLVASGGAQQ